MQMRWVLNEVLWLYIVYIYTHQVVRSLKVRLDIAENWKLKLKIKKHYTK